MTMITMPKAERPADRILRMVRAGVLVLALVVASSLLLAQFDTTKECRGGAFIGFNETGAQTFGFNEASDMKRCYRVVRWYGREIMRISLA